MFSKKMDSSHVALIVALVLALVVVAFQAIALRDTKRDVTRFKQVGVWALVHSEHDFSRYVRERDANEAMLRKYLTADALQALYVQTLTAPLPGRPGAIPDDPPVDSAALQEVMTIAASSRS